ncbi:MAG: type II toxin-antitoxin system RelE/ParE family toxin [Tepidisphaeraceae bacterium]
MSRAEARVLRRVRTTVHADADIRSIAQWIARDSAHAAAKWIDDLEREFSKIAQTPGIGTDRNDLRPQLRSVAFGNYLIFFKSMHNGVIVVRVIHGARDYAAIFRRR